MTQAELSQYFGALWPYLVVIFVGYLPTEMWRFLAVLIAKDLSADSDLLVWVRLVASALLAAVVAKILVLPTGALTSIPLWGRVLSLAGCAAALLLMRRSVTVAVIVGELLLIGSWFFR